MQTAEDYRPLSQHLPQFPDYLYGALLTSGLPGLLLKRRTRQWHHEQERRKNKELLMFYWLCLPFKFVWLCLMFSFSKHFRLSSCTNPLTGTSHTPHTHQKTHCFRSGCQSALLIFKGSRAWNRDCEHGPEFLFSDLPLSFASISVSLVVF